MAVEITYPDGTKIVIPRAVVFKDNYVEGMFDFLDGHGNLVDQIPMQHGLHLRTTDDPPVKSEEEILQNLREETVRGGIYVR